VLSVVFVALALGLSNFAVAIGIGLSGVDRALRWRVGVVFGAFEAGMPIVGLLVGQHVAGTFGSASHLVAGLLLIATGAYTLYQAHRAGDEPSAPTHRTATLIPTGLALSIDNLVVGFALGTRDVPLPLAVAVIATVSVAMSLAGLELGARLGTRVERHSDQIGGAILVAVGIAITIGLL
jgi:putative Mn2+ efflux pump MntP